MSSLGKPPIITVFGGGGFIGRYVVEALARKGALVRVAQRKPKRAYFLQPLGGVGQVQIVAADLTRPASVKRAVDGASAVINLVGTFGHDMQAIHVEGARTAAMAAKEAGASAFVQVSAIGADPASPSVYGRTKGQGEEAVRKAFPGATIIRPSTVFGPEDQFTNMFAGMAALPFVPVIAPDTKFQPVYVRDRAAAIAAAALDPKAHGGKSYEVGGPDVLTMRALNEKVAAMAGRSPTFLDLPDSISGLIAMFGFLPGVPLNRDQWKMLQRDNVAGKKMPGLADFGIAATPLEEVAPSWLGRFIKGGRFAVQG